MNTLLIILITGGIGLAFSIALVKTTKGKGLLLLQSIQSYGYDSVHTLNALKPLIVQILIQEGYETNSNLTIFHEIGNKFTGTFMCSRASHKLIIKTDGETIEYQIDDNIPKTWRHGTPALVSGLLDEFTKRNLKSPHTKSF